MPPWVTLREAGLAWWKWAWSTPQACAWGDGVGHESFIARRAQLEDMVAALHAVGGLDFSDVEWSNDAPKIGRELRLIISAVAAASTGHLQLMKEMRELDDRLGLTPKGMEALRWKIVADAEPEVTAPAPTPGVTRIDSRRSRLTGTDA